MFLSMVALGSLALALITRRPLWALLRRRFRLLGLLWLGAGLHVAFAIPLMSPYVAERPVPGLPPIGGLLYVGSLSVLLLFAWLNRRHLGVAVIGLGLLMNAIVIASNGGQMPIDPSQLAAKGALEETLAITNAGKWDPYVVESANTRLGFLGDWISIPRPLIGPVILSPGDLVIAAGILLFFVVIPEAASARGES